MKKEDETHGKDHFDRHSLYYFEVCRAILDAALYLPGRSVIVSEGVIIWIAIGSRGRGWIFCWPSWELCSVLVSTFCGKTNKKARIEGYGNY